MYMLSHCRIFSSLYHFVKSLFHRFFSTTVISLRIIRWCCYDDVVMVDCSGFLPLSISDAMTSTTAACTAGTTPGDELCQQPRLTNSAMMNVTPQVSCQHLHVTCWPFMEHINATRFTGNQWTRHTENSSHVTSSLFHFRFCATSSLIIKLISELVT